MEWWGWLAATLAAVVLIANAIRGVRDVFAPARTMGERMRELEKHDKRH